MTNKLTPKQEAFAQKDIEYSNGYKAYVEVYNASGMERNSIDVEVSKLRATPKIALRQDQIRAEAAERNAVTLDEILNGLRDARKMSYESEDISNLRGSSMDLAKIGGFITDKITSKHTVQIDGYSTEMLERAGINAKTVSKLIEGD